MSPCSMTNPSGIGASDLSANISASERRKIYEAPGQDLAGRFPTLDTCSGCNDPEMLRMRRDGEINLRPMQVTHNKDDIAADRINPWTRDMQKPTPGDMGCSNAIVSLSCGVLPPATKTRAPKDYMADMPEDSAIVLNSRGHCFLKDETLRKENAGDNMGMSLDRVLDGEAARAQQWEESLDSWSSGARPLEELTFPAMPSAAQTVLIDKLADGRRC